MQEGNVTASYEIGPYVLKCRDPYGMWTIFNAEDERQEIPRELQGHFTSQWDAEQAIKGYNTKKDNERNAQASQIKQAAIEKAEKEKAKKEVAQIKKQVEEDLKQIAE